MSQQLQVHAFRCRREAAVQAQSALPASFSCCPAIQLKQHALLLCLPLLSRTPSLQTSCRRCPSLFTIKRCCRMPRTRQACTLASGCRRMARSMDGCGIRGGEWAPACDVRWTKRGKPIIKIKNGTFR